MNVTYNEMDEEVPFPFTTRPPPIKLQHGGIRPISEPDGKRTNQRSEGFKSNPGRNEKDHVAKEAKGNTPAPQSKLH